MICMWTTLPKKRKYFKRVELMTSSGFKLDDITPDISISSEGLSDSIAFTTWCYCSDGNQPLWSSRSICRPALEGKRRSPGRPLGSACAATPAHSYSAAGSPRSSTPALWAGSPSAWRTPGSAGTAGLEESSSACWTSCPAWWWRQRHRGGWGGQTRTRFGGMKWTGDGKLLASGLSSEEREDVESASVITLTMWCI